MLIAQNIPVSEQCVDLSARVNTFLQSWKPLRRTRTGLNKNILSLHLTAKKFGVRTDGLIISQDLQRLQPIWYHSDVNCRICYLNHGSSSYLRDTHGILTVKDAETLSHLLDCVDHRPSDECECKGCNTVEKEIGCLTLHSCASRASKLLNTLPPKGTQDAPYLEGPMRLR